MARTQATRPFDLPAVPGLQHVSLLLWTNGHRQNHHHHGQRPEAPVKDLEVSEILLWGRWGGTWI